MDDLTDTRHISRLKLLTPVAAVDGRPQKSFSGPRLASATARRSEIPERQTAAGWPPTLHLGAGSHVRARTQGLDCLSVTQPSPLVRSLAAPPPHSGSCYSRASLSHAGNCAV